MAKHVRERPTAGGCALQLLIAHPNGPSWGAGKNAVTSPKPRALVYVNTLMLQDVLAEPAWADILTPADRRGLTPLFWMHVLPYGEVHLDMSSRLRLGPIT